LKLLMLFLPQQPSFVMLALGASIHVLPLNARTVRPG